MLAFHDILWSLTNDELGFRLRLLERKPHSPKKADLIDAIKTCYSGSGLNAVWSSLNDLEQKAVAEACYAPDFTHLETRFDAKYDSLPPFCTRPKDAPEYQHTSWDSKRATRLNLLLFFSPATRSRVVPADLAERLRQFVPKPPATAVPTLAEPKPEEGLCVRLTEHEALSEVLALLRLAEQGNLKVSAATGMPSAAGCAKILECLTGGDFFPPEVAYLPHKKSYEQEIGPIKPVGWARLLQAGKYVAADGAKSKLTPAGIKALSQAPHEIIRHLWTKWLDNSAFDEFNRIDVIKGQSSKGHMTAKPPRRSVICSALSDCPVNQWVDLAKFSTFMLAEGFEFEVSNDLGKLYLCELRYGNFDYSGYGDWHIVQFRYLLCLLFEYAASLGLIDIAYVHPRCALDDFRDQWGADDLEWLSRYDGLRAFRITHLGAYCLGMTEDFKPTQPISSLKLSVLPNLSIRILAGSSQAAERFLLETWAEPVAAGIWRLEPVRGREAIERGQSVADLAAFLRQCDDQPLPETVEGFFKTCESDGRALQNRGEAQLFECRDAKTATAVYAQKELLNQCFRIGETHLAVPTAHLAKFRKVVRSLGLGIV